MPRKSATKPSLPKIGAVFIASLSDGRYGACRILRDTPYPATAEYLKNFVFVGVTPYIGKTKPSLNNPQLRKILKLNQHDWNNSYAVHWLPDPVPNDFEYIGEIQPTHKEKAIEWLALSRGWSITEQVLHQWRWDNERDKVLQEDAINKQAQLVKQSREKKKYQKRLTALTLEKLKGKRRFRKWRRLVRVAIIDKACAIIEATISHLIKFGLKPKKSEIQRALKKCVLDFNKLDNRYENFIETEEREDIITELIEIGVVSGISDTEEIMDVIDKFRRW